MTLTARYVSADKAQDLNWAGLENAAVEPAPFALEAMLLPKLQKADKVFCVEGGTDLHLAVPLRPATWHDRVVWSDITASSLPHFTSKAAVDAFVRGLEHPLLLPQLPMGSAFFKALQDSGARLALIKRWQRAALTFEGNYEDWDTNNFSTKRRREYRRLWARLNENGGLVFTMLAKGEEASPWIEQFLALEAKGWKGAAGTALGKTSGNREIFTKACTQLHDAGRLRFWGLNHGGEPIAMLFGVVERGEAAIVKIAYNEAFAKFSPGVLLLLQSTRAMFEEGLRQADSCAAPNHPMIDNIWRGRLDFADVLVAAPAFSHMKFYGVSTVLRITDGTRTMAKRLLRR